MGGPSCAVAHCSSNYNHTVSSNSNGKLKDYVSFHMFPKEEKLRQVWVKACNRAEPFNPDKSYICSRHFEDADLANAMYSSVMNTKRRLSQTALPKKFLKLEEVDSATGKSATQPTYLRLPITEQDQSSRTFNSNTTDTVLVHKILTNLQVPSREAINKLTVLNESKIEELNVLETELQLYDRQQKELDKEEHEIESALPQLTKLDETCNSLFSKAQYDILLKTTSMVVWSTSDILKTITIKYLSCEGLTYLKNELKYPLPSNLTLSRWVSKFSFYPGILSNVLSLMKIAALNKTDLQTNCVLQFGEMNVEEMYEYDKFSDRVIGTHETMQVILAQGIQGNWKQVVYVDFDKQIGKEILFDIIGQLHAVSFNVVACVSDCKNKNVEVWQNLDISINKSYFLHPITEKKVFCIIDSSHLLGILRSYLLKGGFVYPNGTIVSKEPLLELINLPKDQQIEEFHSLVKLDIEKLSTDDVNSAMKIFSHLTSNALVYHQACSGLKVSLEMAKFISMVRAWFDIMNDVQKGNKLCEDYIEDCYGSDLKNQNVIFDKMREIILKIRCVGQTTLQNFQEAIIISINSVQQLYRELKQKYPDLQFIATRSLTLNSLRDIFLQIGSREYTTGISPLNAIHAIKEVSFSHEMALIADVVRNAKLNINFPDPVDTVKGLLFPLINKSTVKNEDNILIYLCGCIAKKFCDKYNTLKLSASSSETIIFPMMENSSFEGYVQPSKEWVAKAKEFDAVFRNFHGETLSKLSHVVKNMVDTIDKDNPDFPREIIECFLLQRLYLRINKLNYIGNEGEAQQCNTITLYYQT